MVTRGSKADPERIATTHRLPSEPHHGPPVPILSQPPLPGHRPDRPGPHQGPLLRGATLPLHHLPKDLRRHHGHPVLPPPQGSHVVHLRRPLLAYGGPTQAIVAACG